MIDDPSVGLTGVVVVFVCRRSSVVGLYGSRAIVRKRLVFTLEYFLRGEQLLVTLLRMRTTTRTYSNALHGKRQTMACPAVLDSSKRQDIKI